MTSEGDDITIKKEQLRALAKSTRKSLGHRRREQGSRAICQRLLSDERVAESRRVLLYSPIETEVDVNPVMERLWTRPKVTVLLPQTDRHIRRVAACPVRSRDDLVAGVHGILQPRRAIPSFPLCRVDVVIVPALLYDVRGFRIGYGSGFYDRLLSRLRPGALKVGVQFEALVRNRLPVSVHDIAVDVVITEERYIHVEKKTETSPTVAVPSECRDV